MNTFKNDSDHAKNKIVGEVKEAAGKITGNERLELKGKMQSSTADIKKNVTDRIDGKKETFAKDVNNRLDKNKKKI